MNLRVGIVGLPNVGKSTLFNALTKQQAKVKNFPFTTIEPNVGVVTVPDERLTQLAALSKSEKIIPTAIEFVDIAGLVKNAHQGEGLGNQFLSHIREVDAIIHVVRFFNDSNVLHVDNRVDPASDIATINTELALADLEHPNAPPLAGKPILYVANVSEEQLRNFIPPDKGRAGSEPARGFLPLSVKIEQELTELTDDERKTFLAEYGLHDTGLNRLIQESYKILNLLTFFTTGPKETRAWTIPQGAYAPQAAGKIHSDLERGFIRAETVAATDLIAAGSYATARRQAKVRDEGKEYIVKDGDVIIFKFSV